MDNKNSILLIDPTFDPASAANCTLLVKVGAKSFSYAIIDTETKKVNAVYDEQECEDTTKKMAERLKNDSYLSLPYQEVKVAVYTANTIAIPKDLYAEEHLAYNAKFFASGYFDNLYVTAQIHFGFNTIFALTKSTAEVISFTDGKKYPENAGLLHQSEQLNGPSLLLDFAVGVVSIIYLNNNSIVFQHSYEIDNAEEFNYYLLLMINQLDIPKHTIVYLSGIIHENDGNYNCLLKYFSSIEFLTVASHLDQQILDDMPAHYYSSLLAIEQCAS